MAASTNGQGRPKFTKKHRRVVMVLALALSLPVVLLGAFSRQDSRQNASETRQTKPNILLLTVQTQSPDTLEYMPIVRDEIGGQGMTFSQAFASRATETLYDSSLVTDLAASDYTLLSTDATEEALSFLRTVTTPFFLSINFPSVLEEDREICGNYVVVPNPAVNEADVSDKPRQVRRLPVLTSAQLDELAERKKADLCALQEIDRSVQRVLSALGTSERDTVVLYTALQGKSYGEHRLIGSDCLYDSCRSVPLLIRYSRFIKAGSLTTGLASTGDIAATIRQLVGLPPQSEGISLLPLFTRPDVPVRQSLFYEMPSQASGSAETDHAIRTKDFMYAELASGEREFYDLQGDPLQLTNQVENGLYTSVIEDLSLELQNRLR